MLTSAWILALVFSFVFVARVVASTVDGRTTGSGYRGPVIRLPFCAFCPRVLCYHIRADSATGGSLFWCSCCFDVNANPLSNPIWCLSAFIDPWLALRGACSFTTDSALPLDRFLSLSPVVSLFFVSYPPPLHIRLVSIRFHFLHLLRIV